MADARVTRTSWRVATGGSVDGCTQPGQNDSISSASGRVPLSPVSARRGRDPPVGPARRCSSTRDAGPAGPAPCPAGRAAGARRARRGRGSGRVRRRRNTRTGFLRLAPRQPAEVGRLDGGVPVGWNDGAQILGDEPEDVGWGGRGSRRSARFGVVLASAKEEGAANRCQEEQDRPCSVPVHLTSRSGPCARRSHRRGTRRPPRCRCTCPGYRTVPATRRCRTQFPAGGCAGHVPG